MKRKDRNATALTVGRTPMGALHVYADESGDLGFSKGSTKHFVMCALATEDPIRISRIVKRVRSKCIGKGLKEMPELKFHQSDDATRLGLLGMLASENVDIWYVGLDKRAIKGAPPEKQNEIYNYLAGFIVERLIKLRSRRIALYLDRCMSMTNRLRFNEYLDGKKDETSGSLGRLPTRLTIEHVSSESMPGIQVADFVAGAIFAKFEHGDTRYYDVILDRITEEVLKRKW